MKHVYQIYVGLTDAIYSNDMTHYLFIGNNSLEMLPFPTNRPDKFNYKPTQEQED